MKTDKRPEKKDPKIPSSQRAKTTADDDLKKTIAAIRDGDEEAFANFYLGYGDSLKRILLKLLRNEEDAREITQDTFALLWENRETLNPHTTLNGYVTGMAKNLALRLIREQGKGIKACELHLHRSEFADLADDCIITEEIAILLKNVLNEMPPQRRKIFEMSREEGLTYNEIATRLDISPNTVKFHIKEALSDIRSAMASMIVFFFFG